MSTGRRYRSTLREERAQDTRRRICDSARDLFTSQGFTDATIAEIAALAGVSPQTIYSVFGSKAAIVGEMLSQLEGAPERAEILAELLDEPDPRRQLRLFVSMHRKMFEKGAPIVRAAMVARGDPDVAAMAERGDSNRRAGTGRLVAMWSDRDALRHGLDPDDAAERLWLLTSADQFLNAIDGLGWSPDHYENWLGDLLERELLEPTAG